MKLTLRKKPINHYEYNYNLKDHSLKKNDVVLIISSLDGIDRQYIKHFDKFETIGKTIEIGGERKVSWNEIIKSIASATGQNVFMLPAPFFVIFTIAGFLDRFEWFPAGQDQLKDLIKGSVCNSHELFKKYEIEPIPFNIENLSYLKG